jgi:hypothetical protein
LSNLKSYTVNSNNANVLGVIELVIYTGKQLRKEYYFPILIHYLYIPKDQINTHYMIRLCTGNDIHSTHHIVKGQLPQLIK